MKISTNTRNSEVTVGPAIRLRDVFAGLLVLSLSACASNDYSDLDGYIKQVKSRPAGRIDPVPEFKSYETYTYSAMNLREPFELYGGEEQEQDKKAVASTSGISPDLDRNKETLEQYPLDTLKFVGHLERAGGKWAIITSPDGLVHRVSVGNHLGTNYGEIISISETEIAINEIVEDGMGGWIERDAALSISE